MRIYQSNSELAERCCSIKDHAGRISIVSEFGSEFTVTVSGQDDVKCSCGRYFDEGIPCQHIICVVGNSFPCDSLISPLYKKSKFIAAFSPEKATFYPSEIQSKLSEPVAQVLDMSVADDSFERKKIEVDVVLASFRDIRDEFLSSVVLTYVGFRQQQIVNAAAAGGGVDDDDDEKESLTESVTSDDDMKDCRVGEDVESLTMSEDDEEDVSSGKNRRKVGKSLVVSLPAPEALFRESQGNRAIPLPTTPVKRPSYQRLTKRASVPSPSKSHKRSSEPLSASAGERKRKRLQSLVPEKYEKLVVHDPVMYGRWEELYQCIFSETVTDYCFIKNEMPTVDNPALMVVVPNVPLDRINCEELHLMSGVNEWNSLAQKNVLSIDVITKFLAHVHAFTAVGLEAQATAFSFTAQGDVKYLAFLPQKNYVDKVISVEGGLTETDAMRKFAEAEPPKSYEGYIPRCWIFTHSRGKAYMTSEELYQLYLRSKTNRNFFSIVLAPRDSGVKALCVQLTQVGFNEIEQYCKEAKAKHQGIKEYVIHHINLSAAKFYYQIPFSVSYELCQVVDLRNGDDVIKQVSKSLTSGRAGNCW